MICKYKTLPNLRQRELLLFSAYFIIAREFLGRFSVLPTEGVVTYVELVGKREMSQKLLAIEIYELNESLILRPCGSFSL